MVPLGRRAWQGAGHGVIALAWLIVAGLWLVSALHLAHREPRSVIVGAIALTPWIYMLAWATAAVGLWSRRYLLGALSLVLVALQVWWVAPDFDPISHLVPLPKGAVEVRIFDANVSQANRGLGEIAGEIRRDRPQVVALEELTPVALASLRATGVMSRYHYSLVKQDYGPYGMGLWSVYPLAGATEWYAFGHPELRAWLELAGHRRLRVDVVHTTAPYLGPGEPFTWEAQMTGIRAELAREPRPLAVVGDLNATWYDWHFQALLSLGLRDAAVVAGQGWRMTWPRDQHLVVPYLRIDHVLLSRTLTLQRYSVSTGGAGSDHHPLLVSIGV